MRRVISVILLVTIAISGCVHTDTAYIEGIGYVPLESNAPAAPEQPAPATPEPAEEPPAPAAAPKPTLPPMENSPAPQSAPAITPRSTPVDTPKQTPAITPTPAPPTPAPSDLEEKATPLPRDELVEPPKEERLYLQPALLEIEDYRMIGRVYSEQELSLLCKLVASQKWSSLQELLGLFGTALYLDIRLCDFSPDGLFAPALTVDLEPLYNEAIGLAEISLLYQDVLTREATEYSMIFKKTEEGYAPLRIVRTAGSVPAKLHERWIQEAGNERFYVTMTEERENNAWVMRERWYSEKDYTLKLSLVYKGEYKSDFSLEQYNTKLNTSAIEYTNYGFTLPVRSEMLLQFIMEGSPTPISMGAEQEYALYYNSAEEAFYVDANRQEFVAEKGKLQPWQYKHVFGEELTMVVQAARHPLEEAWAANLLAMEEDTPLDWPEEENRHALPNEQEQIQRISIRGTESRLFSQLTLQSLAEDIRNMREDSLMQLAARYAIVPTRQFTEEQSNTEPPFDITWNDVKLVSYSLDITTARERLAVMELRYTEKGKHKTLLLCFALEGNAWQFSSAYSFAPHKTSQLGKLQYQDGLLYYTFTQDVRNNQPVETTLVLNETGLQVQYVSGYQGKDGTAYSLAFQKAPGSAGLTGAFMITAVLKGEETPVLTYRLPVWSGHDGDFTNDIAANLLLHGEIEKHEGYNTAMEAATVARKQLAEKLAQAEENFALKQEEPARRPREGASSDKADQPAS